MALAIVTPSFYSLATCETACNDFFYNDTTEMKLHYQNCTTKCALSYESANVDNFMSCGMNNECLQFDSLGNATCPSPEVDPESSLDSLKGEWWQQYGKNALWDCYPCQHIHEMKMIDDEEWCSQTVGPDGPVKAPCWSYDYSYDLFTMEDTKYFGQVW
jgi:hypothetical protein